MNYYYVPPARNRSGLIDFISQRGLVVSVVIGLVFTLLSGGDWIVLVGTVCMWSFWRFLPHQSGPPGLQFAFSYHMVQIILGVFYVVLTGRRLGPHAVPTYHLMMVIATGALMAMFVGFLLADRWMARLRAPMTQETLGFTLRQLIVGYAVLVASHDYLVTFASENPAFRQGIVAIAASTAGLLYLVLRQLFREQRYILIVALLLFETARGFSGYYSSFKEPLILALIATMEIFDPKKARHWGVVVLLVSTVIGMSVLWLGIRGVLRYNIDSTAVAQSRTERVMVALEEARNWFKGGAEYQLREADSLAERVWDIYYTSLALARVPAVLPHEEGRLMSAAVQHVLTPRFLNPDKPDLPSESEDVKRYSGVWVAGREMGTTIGFGYVIQSYIDYGIPMMFVPPLIFGMILGAGYRWFMTQIHYQEILIAIAAVAFWMNIMPYNISWAKMLGKLLTSMVYVGGLAVLLDYYMYTSRSRRAPAQHMPLVEHPVRR